MTPWYGPGVDDTPAVAESNVQIAARLGISPAAVSRFRGGSRVPRMATMRRIAEVYGWTISEQAVAHSQGSEIYRQGFEHAVVGTDA